MKTFIAVNMYTLTNGDTLGVYYLTELARHILDEISYLDVLTKETIFNYLPNATTNWYWSRVDSQILEDLTSEQEELYLSNFNNWLTDVIRLADENANTFEFIVAENNIAIAYWRDSVCL